MEFKFSYTFDLDHLKDIFRVSDIKGDDIKSRYHAFDNDFLFFFDFDGIIVGVAVPSVSVKDFIVGMAFSHELKSL